MSTGAALQETGLQAPRYRDARVGGCLSARVVSRSDGATLVESTEALLPYPDRLSDRLQHWAQTTPDRIFVARRGPPAANGTPGDWVTLTYAQMWQRAQAVGQALVDRGLSAERPVAILSENSLEHLSLAMGALWVGVPWVPISTAYSLVSQDFGKLRHIVHTTTPGLVLASSPAYGRAIAAAVPHDVEVVLAQGELSERPTQPFDSLLATVPGPSAAAAHAATGPETIAKFLFTSGSTKMPKGVITTHRMLCCNQQMIRQTLGFLAEEPPVLVDWLPWNHVFGGSHNVGIALYNGGTLYIDDGKPTPADMAQTLHNLREISPTIYFNVPKGLEEIARAMDGDPALRDRLFARCKALFFSGAALSQAVWDQLHDHAQASVGERVRIITGLGMTETSPSCTFAVGTDVASGHIGLPMPGVQVKLVAQQEKVEIRFRGPHVMPGYWRDPDQTREAFDEEGYYRTGDAVQWIDPQDPQRGLRFDGRTAEDFKLSTGTFVSVGPLRARIILAGDPCVQDAVITGLNRNEVGALLFVRPQACRALAGELPAEAPMSQVLDHPAVRAFFQRLANRLRQEATGSANRVTRLLPLEDPPSMDRGEATDKGSINQRAVLQHRSALVESLYTDPSPHVIVGSSSP